MDISRAGDTVDVNVVLEELDFSAFEKVIQKELDLFDSFPELEFRFNVIPAEAIEEVPAILHAA